MPYYIGDLKSDPDSTKATLLLEGLEMLVASLWAEELAGGPSQCPTSKLGALRL